MITSKTTDKRLRRSFLWIYFKFPVTVLLSLFTGSELVSQTTSITLGADRDYPPYEFIDDAGQPTGFNIELIKAIEKVCSLDINIYTSDFNSIRRLAEVGKLDGLTGFYRSQEREKLFCFTDRVATGRKAYASRVNNPVKEFKEALKLRIGVQESDQLEDFLLSQGYSGIIKTYKSPVIGLNALLANECDLFVGMEKQLEYSIELYGMSNLRVTSLQLPSDELCIALNKNSCHHISKLNSGLSLIKKSGVYDQLYSKWFRDRNYRVGLTASKKKSSPWEWALLISIVILAVFILYYVYNRKRKTRLSLIEFNQFLELRGSLLIGYMDAVVDNFALIDSSHKPIWLNKSMKKFLSLKDGYEIETKKGFFDNRDLAFVKNILPELAVGKVWQTDLNFKDEGLNEKFYELTLVKLKQAYGVCIKDISKQRKNDKLNHILLNIANAAISSSSLFNLYKVIHQEIATLFDASNFTVELYDSSTQIISVSYSIDSLSNDQQFLAKGTLSGDIIKRNRPKLFLKAEIQDLIEKGEINETEIMYFNWLGVPLIVRGACFGVISVRSYNESTSFSEDELKVMEFISGQVASAIHRKLSDNEIIKALELAQEANHLKASFISKLSHEFRTPMTSILGFCSLLGERSLTESQYHSYLNSMKEGTDNLLKIIDQILDIAQIESGKLKIDVDWVDIGSLIKELYLMFQMNPYYQKNKIAFTYVIDNDPIMALSDRRRLRDALGHLIDNAFKFTKSGSLELGASHDYKNARVVIWIKDSGIGISDKLAETIFDSFRQGDEKISRSFEGMGLGLNLAKGFIDYMHGELWFENNDKGGTTFYISLPDHEERMPVPDSNSMDVELNAEYIWPGKTILIAEDNLSNSRFLEAALTGRGLRLLFTNNGVDTIDLVERDPAIDLILMDIQMPKVNGIEATKRIRAIRNDLPVIAVTAYAYNVFSEDLLNITFDAWLTKPVRTREILKSLSRFLS